MPLTEEELKKKNDAAKRKAELDALEPITFPELERTVKEWLLVADPGIIKLMPAIVIANRLQRKPIWLFLIGPSGGGKTEFLSGLCDLHDIYPLSLLTPNTLLSGTAGRNDTSLLPKINKKILVFKDWTNLLSQNKEARGEIMGQLRDLYDGHVKKAFGTGKIAEWGPGGKVGIIAAVTPAVDLQQQMHATLGERFVHYRLLMPDRIEVAMRALSNDDKHERMEVTLRNAFYAFFKGVTIPDPLPEIPKDIQGEIIRVANLATMARSGVIREFSFKKEVIFVPAAEMPTRIVQQLNTLAVALIIVNGGEFMPDDMNIIYKVALDSIPQTNRMVMNQMARRKERTTSDIATSLGYPTGPIRMYLENLALLGLCDRVKASDSEEGGVGDRWTLKDEFKVILEKYEAVSPIEKAEGVDPALEGAPAWEDIGKAAPATEEVNAEEQGSIF